MCTEANEFPSEGAWGELRPAEENPSVGPTCGLPSSMRSVWKRVSASVLGSGDLRRAGGGGGRGNCEAEVQSAAAHLISLQRTRQLTSCVSEEIRLCWTGGGGGGPRRGGGGGGGGTPTRKASGGRGCLGEPSAFSGTSSVATSPAGARDGMDMALFFRGTGGQRWRGPVAILRGATIDHGLP